MAQTSPLLNRHQDAAVPMLPFGDPETAPPALVAETYGALEAEYAAIRKGCALFDLPQIGILTATGAERIDFLNRFLTQELMPNKAPLPPFTATQAFWLNRKGRVQADLRVINLQDQTLLLADTLCAARTRTELDAFIFGEDIEITDSTPERHAFALHGPSTLALLTDLATPLEGSPPLDTIATLGVTQATIADQTVLIVGDQSLGELGCLILCNTDSALTVFDALARFARTDHGHNNAPETDTYRLRLAGWHAMNIARIEAGTPLFHIDFDEKSLPGETGLLNSRVSFTKGCYLGQEVVARMQSLGHPKQTTVALKCEGPADQSIHPETGSPIATIPTESDPKVVGAVSSCTRSPMLGNNAICLGPVKWGHHEPGTTLQIGVTTESGEPQWVNATVQQGLAQYRRP